MIKMTIIKMSIIHALVTIIVVSDNISKQNRNILCIIHIWLLKLVLLTHVRWRCLGILLDVYASFDRIAIFISTIWKTTASTFVSKLAGRAWLIAKFTIISFWASCQINVYIWHALGITNSTDAVYVLYSNAPRH